MKVGDVLTPKVPQSQDTWCGFYWFEDSEVWRQVRFEPSVYFLVVTIHEEDEFPDEILATLVSLENGTSFKFRTTKERIAATCDIVCSGEYQA